MTEVHQEFWDLVSECNLSILTLSQMINAPIKILLDWRDNGNTPESGLNDLKRFLKGAREHE